MLNAADGGLQEAGQVAARAVQVMRRAAYPAERMHAYLTGLETWQPGRLTELCSVMGGPFDNAEGRSLAVQVLTLHDPPLGDRLRQSFALQQLHPGAAALLPDAFP